MPRPPRDPLAVRDRALRTVRRTTRACAAGALGLATGLTFLASHALSDHATGKAHDARAGTAAATSRIRVPPPQPVPQIHGAPPTPQPPAQAPSSDAAPSTSAPDPAASAPADPSASAPAPAPAPTVSGGS